MKHKIMLAYLLALCLILSIPGKTALAEELDIINRPVNTSGLTGLLFTTAPYTLSKGTIEIGVSILNESSDIPKFTIIEFPVSISVGLPKNSELALRTSYFNIKSPSSTTPSTSTYEGKTGDVELSYKWNFLLQPEDSWRPALALIITGIAPTDNYRNMIINGVSDWGMRIGLSTGTELRWRDYILGIYADAQAQGQDLSREKGIRDFYGIFNAGLIFPISKYRNLQMFIEFTQVYGRDRITLDGGDYSGFSYGVRLVSERFNLTIGSEFLHKQTQGYDNSNRLIGLVSVKL